VVAPARPLPAVLPLEPRAILWDLWDLAVMLAAWPRAGQRVLPLAVPLEELVEPEAPGSTLAVRPVLLRLAHCPRLQLSNLS